MAVESSVGIEETTTGHDELRWHRIRVRCVVGYFALLALFLFLVGVPSERVTLLLWTLAGLSIRCVGRGWRSVGRVLLDWLPFSAVLVAYDYTRSIADDVGIATHVWAPIDADRWLAHGTVPTVFLQQHFYTPGITHWYDGAATLVYTSHFLATPIIAVVLWVRNRQRWAGFIGRIVALSLGALVCYVLYPAAPPWYASQEGVIPPVFRLSSRGWYELHLAHAGSVLAGAQASANAVAAMPSLHTATATVVALYLVKRCHLWGKVLCALYPLAMGCALIYTGEHYLVDILFGYAYGGLVMLAARPVQRAWTRWGDRRIASAGTPDPYAPF